MKFSDNALSFVPGVAYGGAGGRTGGGSKGQTSNPVGKGDRQPTKGGKGSTHTKTSNSSPCKDNGQTYDGRGWCV